MSKQYMKFVCQHFLGFSDIKYINIYIYIYIYIYTILLRFANIKNTSI
jgi:hypothetical protein